MSVTIIILGIGVLWAIGKLIILYIDKIEESEAGPDWERDE